MQSQKWQNDLSFQGKPFNITVIQVHGPISNAEAEAEAEWFYEDLQDLLELIPPKICSFHYRGLEYKSKKSRDTWSIRQVWPWGSKWSREKANRDLPREHTGYSKQPFQQHKDDSTQGHHQTVNTKSRLIMQPKLEKLYTGSKSKTWRWLWLRSWSPYRKTQTPLGPFLMIEIAFRSQCVEKFLRNYTSQSLFCFLSFFLWFTFLF